MIRALILIIVLWPMTLAAQDGKSQSFKLGEARAISGHEFEIKGRRILMRDYRCQDPSTEKGRRAKALMNQFLRTNITCIAVEDDGRVVGDCWANSKLSLIHI